VSFNAIQDVIEERDRVSTLRWRVWRRIAKATTRRTNQGAWNMQTELRLLFELSGEILELHHIALELIELDKKQAAIELLAAKRNAHTMVINAVNSRRKVPKTQALTSKVDVQTTEECR
jgi:hypothetical protein